MRCCIIADVHDIERAEKIGVDFRSVDDLKKLNKNKKLVKKLDLGGMKVPMLRKKRLGGVAGMAHKYPYHTAGLGGLYYLSKKNKGHLVSPVPYEQLAMLRQQVPDYRPVPPIRGTF